MVLAILLSFSRSAWVAGLILLFVSWFTKTEVVRGALLTTLFLTIFPLGLARLPDFSEAAIADRQSGIAYAQELLRESPIWHGVGPGNYQQRLGTYFEQHQIPHQPWEVAPVHSVPLLLVVEWGVLPAFALCVSLIAHLRKRLSKSWHVLLPFIPLLLVDHYLLTQPAPLLYLAMLLFALPRPQKSASVD
jgi:hypothetical protein